MPKLRRSLALILSLALALSVSRAQESSNPSSSTGFTRLFSTGVSSGNGADLTEDALSTCSYNMPANTLANVGDTIHIFAAGTFAATTDSKSARIRTGSVSGNLVGAANGNIAAATRWAIHSYIVKTGPNAQSVGSSGVVTSASSSALANTLAMTESGAILITATGNNTTASAAGSITCQLMVVNFEH